MDVPTQMGRDGAQVVDELFFTLLLSNPNNFFSTGNGNYLEGATTTFGPDSLTTAMKNVAVKKTSMTSR